MRRYDFARQIAEVLQWLAGMAVVGVAIIAVVEWLSADDKLFAVLRFGPLAASLLMVMLLALAARAIFDMAEDGAERLAELRKLREAQARRG